MRRRRFGHFKFEKLCQPFLLQISFYIALAYMNFCPVPMVCIVCCLVLLTERPVVVFYVVYSCRIGVFIGFIMVKARVPKLKIKISTIFQDFLGVFGIFQNFLDFLEFPRVFKYFQGFLKIFQVFLEFTRTLVWLPQSKHNPLASLGHRLCDGGRG